MAEAISNYLYRVHKEAVPRWLEEGDFSLDRFFESRTVCYLGSGCDGSPVKLFNRGHASHCFVWVDQSYDFDEMVAMGELSLKGYGIHEARQVGLTVRTDYESPVGNTSCSHMVVYDRASGFGDEHGAARLAIVFVRAEAHSAYEQIYGERFGNNPPFAVVVQDHGLGGNFTGHEFGGPNSPVFKAAQRNGLPSFVLFGERAERTGADLWPGYASVDNVRATFGGMHRNRRWLCQLRADKRREHAELVRPYLELAARFRLPGDRIAEWLEFNGVPPPSGRNAWTRQSARRVGRRLSLWPYQ